MKPAQTVFFALTMGLMGACQSSPTSPVTSAPPTETGRLQELEGTWVGHTESGFTLIKITSDSTGTYTQFTDREKKTGKGSKITRYWLYESPIQVKYVALDQEPNVFIQTQRYRFDYVLQGDTLQEIDKMGRQGTLVRVKSDKH